MTRDDLIALAKKTANKYGLFPELVCGIVEQESKWNTWAIRYEPQFYEHYIKPLVEKGQIVGATEAQARTISWGLMQVIGEVARENGFKGQFLSELCNPETGLDIGCRVFAQKLGHVGGDTEKALGLWNGGSRPTY